MKRELSAMAEIETQVLLKERGVKRRYGIEIPLLRKRRRLHLDPPFLKIGRGVYYRVADLEAWLDRCTVSAKTGEGNGGKHGDI